MIRTLFVITWTLIATLLMGTLTILLSFFDKTGNLPHSAARAWARSILRAGRIRVKVRGLNHIDGSRPCIFMCNHQSNFDIPVLMAHLPAQFRWLAKAELFKIPFFGYAMRRAGYISIDRSNRKSAFHSLKKAAEIIRNGTSVIVFPEGTRSRDGRIGSFKKGGFILAIDSGVPIIPVSLHGTWPIMPKNTLKIRPGRVTIDIQPPVETSNFTRKGVDVLQGRVRDTIFSAFNSLQKVNGKC